MVADAEAARSVEVDGNEVHAQGQRRQRGPVRELPSVAKRRHGTTQRLALAVVERLLGQAEVPPTAAAHLDHHQPAWRAGVDGNDVQLVTTESEVARQNRPAGRREALGDERFRLVPGELGRGRGLPRHRVTVASDAYPGLIARFDTSARVEPGAAGTQATGRSVPGSAAFLAQRANGALAARFSRWADRISR